jgi:chaperonin GroES
MNLKPLGDRVIIKVLEKEEKTSTGIVIPEKAKEKPQEGEIKAVGPGRVLDDGTRVQMDVKEGDRVVYSKYAGTEIKIAGEEYLILRQDDILGVFS